MTYTRSFSENSDSEHKENESDIDMAVVFAKFLNQNLNSGQEFNNEANMSSSSSSTTLSNILTPQSVEAENDESKKPCECDLITVLESYVESFLEKRWLRIFLGRD